MWWTTVFSLLYPVATLIVFSTQSTEILPALDLFHKDGSSFHASFLPFLPFFSFPFGLSFFLLFLLSLMHVLDTHGKDWSDSADGWSHLFIPRIKVRILWAPYLSIYFLFKGSHSFHGFKNMSLLMIPKSRDLSSKFQSHRYNCLLVSCIS